MKARTYAVIPLLVSATAVAGCGGGQRPATPPGGGQVQAAAATDTGAADAAVTTTVAQAPANLAGSWALRTEDHTRRGPLLELVIDSVTGAAFRVRVAFLMSGDVGIDPTRFESSPGTVDQGGVVSFSVKLGAQAEPVGQLSGTLGQDTIRLNRFRWAGEDQTAGGKRWLLVKQPP